MSSLCSTLSMTSYITQGKSLSLHHHLPGSTLLLLTTVPTSPITPLLVTPVMLVPLFLSQVKHTPGTRLSQGLGVCSPLPTLHPRYLHGLIFSSCLVTAYESERASLTPLKQHHPSHYHLSTFHFLHSSYIGLTGLLLLPLRWKLYSSFVPTAVSPALRTGLLLVLNQDLE